MWANLRQAKTMASYSGTTMTHWVTVVLAVVVVTRASSSEPTITRRVVPCLPAGLRPLEDLSIHNEIIETLVKTLFVSSRRCIKAGARYLSAQWWGSDPSRMAAIASSRQPRKCRVPRFPEVRAIPRITPSRADFSASSSVVHSGKPCYLFHRATASRKSDFLTTISRVPDPFRPKTLSARSSAEPRGLVLGRCRPQTTSRSRMA